MVVPFSIIECFLSILYYSLDLLHKYGMYLGPFTRCGTRMFICQLFLGFQYQGIVVFKNNVFRKLYSREFRIYSSHPSYWIHYGKAYITSHLSLSHKKGVIMVCFHHLYEHAAPDYNIKRFITETSTHCFNL